MELSLVIPTYKSLDLCGLLVYRFFLIARGSHYCMVQLTPNECVVVMSNV